MRKIILTIFSMALLLSYTSVNAQRICGTNEIFVEQLKNDPDFAAQYKKIEGFTSEYIRKGGSRTLVPQLNAGTVLYTIPVVVHVVYNTAAQNVSDAQIQSQIDVLNKDYQLLNPDASSVPTPFKPLVADCKIQFCLAKRDPSGNATTGIVRKSTTRASFSTNDAVKKAQYGDVAWDATKYLNIWVCNLSGGVLGYAQFPGGPVATDGVVITYTGFGTNGTAASPFNLGRTATHEVGHWLNLYHIWGDDGTSCSGTDNVGDTPNQADENYGKPVFPIVSCSNGPNGDMFMNYMDYVDDNAMFMFTVGQRDRMYALFQSGGARAAILASQGCTPPATATCNVPAPAVGSITQAGATISWAAVTGAVSYDLQYKTSAAASYTTVAGLTTTSYSLTALTAGTVYNYHVKTNCSASSSAYSTTSSFTTLAAPTCSDVYESNNTIATAATIAVNTPITAVIGSATDNDYFKFNNTAAAKNIQIALTNLPADYDIKLYGPSGGQIGSSQKTGTASETILYNTSVVGTFKVLVAGKSGAFSNSCYTLETDISASRLKTTEKVAELIATKVAVKVYPQPAKGVANLQFDGNWKGITNVAISNQLGVRVGSVNMNVEGGYGKLDVSNLKPGMYYLRLSNGERSVTQKLLVQK